MKNLYFHLGMIWFNIFVIMPLNNVRIFLKLIKIYVNGIDIANRFHKIIIPLIHPLMTLYDYHLKYYSPDNMRISSLGGFDGLQSGT